MRDELKSLNKHNGSIKRVWVCGTPALSETFEKIFDGIAEEGFLGLSPY